MMKGLEHFSFERNGGLFNLQKAKGGSSQFI